MFKGLFNKNQKSQRTLIPPHAFVSGQYVPITAEDIAAATNVEVINGRRTRQTRYAEVLEMTLEDYATTLFSDDDLEEAVYLLTQYAKSRGYKIAGDSRQVLLKLHTWSETH